MKGLAISWTILCSIVTVLLGIWLVINQPTTFVPAAVMIVSAVALFGLAVLLMREYYK